ncbi:lasso RiPP family leader peptide-containing protein [Nocardioides rotundus]|nr:keywimysin-related RiPP [Nocardioides rotundus]UAL30441.1 lasso RiPP family leader peptide-containing protein [Nocardioides rotundus]
MKAYETPMLVERGTFSSLTAGLGRLFADRVIPVGRLIP